MEKNKSSEKFVSFNGSERSIYEGIISKRSTRFEKIKKKIKHPLYSCQGDPILTALKNIPQAHEFLIVLPFVHNDFRINSHLPSSFHKKRLNESDIQRVFVSLRQLPNFMPKENFCLKVTMIFLGTIMFVIGLLWIGISESQDYESILSPIWVGILTVLMITILAFCFNLLINFLYLKFLKKREKDFEKLLDIQNKYYFLSKGVMWRVGRYGAWLELVLDSLKVERFKIMSMRLDNVKRRKRSKKRGKTVYGSYADQSVKKRAPFTERRRDPQAVL